MNQFRTIFAKLRWLLPLVLASHAVEASCAVAAESYADTVLADRPIAYYRFEETGGEVAKDSTANGHEALYKGDVRRGVESASPELGTAIRLGADKARVHILRHTDFKFGTDNLTIECWLNCQEKVADRGDLISFKGEGKDFALFKANGNLNLAAYAKPGRAFQAQTDPFTAGVWHHVVYVRAENVDCWYVDGQLSGTATGHVMNIDMNADILVGANHIGSPDTLDEFCLWNGLVDELAFYKAALTAEQIALHYRAGLGGNGAAAKTQQESAQPSTLPAASTTKTLP